MRLIAEAAVRATGRKYAVYAEQLIQDGGILCDIGSHQIEQYLFYAGEEDGDGEILFSVGSTVSFPYFGRLILDCLNRTENAMTQAHAFKAAELSVTAETQAVPLRRENAK